MKSSDIRKAFLQYFERQGHAVVASSPLVPANDPTLLFTNSGMVQFKDVFLGHEKRSYVRATTAQRCVRAGGKHNDLENVGYTARHHTFFEMLGNFSFGDYFKRDAIRYAWELLTKVYGLAPERMWTTVYHEDDQAYDIWTKEIGVPKERCVRIGDKPGAPKYQSDNFWQMADTGPCGPCSEIFWDHGSGIPGGPPGSKDADGDRFVEIWNLVFMQFNRDETGAMHPLPKPSVDTGMGLERIAAVLQGVHSNYEIDLFQDLIKAAARETHTHDYSSNSLKVIADHIRACSFLIVDGVIPANEGRGYVLRRIVRRAIRHGYKLGQSDPFFHRLVPDLVREMGSAYPELPKAAERVAQVLRQEEERFAETLANGMRVLEGALNREDRMLDGETVFQLYDTFGFPVDLTADIARERDVRVDYAGFEAAMERQRERARRASKFTVAAHVDYRGAATEFHGYDALQLEANVVALYDHEGVQVPEIEAGAGGIVVLDRTPFYAESGGQVGDRGELAGVNGTFEVQDTQKIQLTVFGHKGVMKTGRVRVGDKVLAAVDTERRARTVRNHSATHLMHKALREVLGQHVQQKGSLVDADRTRFDFSHNEPLTDDEIRRVEALVNGEILANVATTARIMKFDEAAKAGALAFFGDKYGDEVRVLEIGSSRELCGGTHVKRTGDIGFFKVISEGGIAAGVRRIEATTGEGALAWVQAMEQGVSDLASEAGFREVNLAGVRQRLAALQESNRALEKELARLKSKLASSRGDELADQAVAVKGVKVVAAAIEGADAKALREAVDKLKGKLKSAAVVLATANGDKVSLIAGVTPDITAKVKAGELVNHVAQQVGGKGGGRADMAQAGGTDPSKLPQALDSVRAWLEQRL
ncbi:MAG TPA: alanine--tRNA ligase [Burkholderiales bacterium]|nr:alanine--tRNA ligase [Burkholderiales bacterium]